MIMKKIFGLVRVGVILAVHFFVFYSILEVKWAVGITMAIAGIAYLGGHINIAKDRAIPLRNLDAFYKSKLEGAFQILCEQGNKVGVDLRHLRLYMVPDEQINSYSYGRNHIGVTKGLLSLDDGNIAGILAHESGHCLHADAFIKRILFCDITIIILSLSVIGFISTGFFWLFFVLLCFCGLCGGCFSFFITRSLGKMVRCVFTGLQHIFMFIYQITVGIISRNMEYSADRFAAKMNLGNELIFFLSRFSVEENVPKTFRNIMYASQPTASKRIKNIEEYCYTILS